MLTIDDALRPEIINVEGRRYRKLPVRSTTNQHVEQPRETYTEEDYYYYDEPESCINEYSTIEKTKDGYCDSIQDIPSYYFKFLIGARSQTKIHIESQTKTSIKFPKRGEDRGDIVITGKERNGIIVARSKITSIIDMKRSDQPADHFLSIPLASKDLIENFNQFKTEVLKLKVKGVEKNLFQFPERLHLTLGMVTILNKAELEKNMIKIQELVNTSKRKHFGDEKIVLHLKGIAYMNDDPWEVDVLYAKVKLHNQSDTSKLQSFVDEFVSSMAYEGYVKQEHDHVKLHATVINSIFRQRKQDTDKCHPNYYTKKVPFDAREILQKFAEFDFGIFPVERIEIAVRGRFEKDGRYRNDGFLSL